MTQNPSFRSARQALPPRAPTAAHAEHVGPEMLRRRPLYAAVHGLSGAALYDGDGELLGHVDEVVVDLDCSRIAYALLPWGGFMGLGERLLALPWRLLAIAGSPQRLLLAQGRERLDDAPALAPHDALPPGRNGWHLALHRHFDIEPYWD